MAKIDWLWRKDTSAPVVMLAGRTLPINIRRLAQAKRMTLRLAPDGSEVRVSLPRWGRTADAVAFAQSRVDWLENQLCALPVAEPLTPGGLLPFRGEKLAILHDPAAPRRVQLADAVIHIGGPLEGLPNRLRRWLESEARELIAHDLAHYCERAGQKAPPLALSQARRRWGSCAADGTIRINWRLIMAPDHVRRSVVAHEVAHLVHFDHSPRFHALLDQLFEGDIAGANHWLKREGRGLYLPFG